MIAVVIVVIVLLAVVSVTLASVEAAFYLVKRRRLSHLEQNPRAELVNRYLADPQTLLMPIHMGTYTAHVVMTVIINLLPPTTPPGAGGCGRVHDPVPSPVP